MPRRGGTRRAASPSRAPARAAPPPPPPAAHPPATIPPQQMMQPQPRQPGMFAQMASTAAGVAVGSAVGHTIGHALTGGSGAAAQESAAPVTPQQPYQQEPKTMPCEVELRQFIECAQDQVDVSVCQGFNDALKECRMRYGIAR